MFKEHIIPTPHAWFAKFNTTVYGFGFILTFYDSAFFLHKRYKGYIFHLLYIDDIIIINDDMASIFDLKASLQQYFEMKDLGNLS